MLVHNESKEW